MTELEINQALRGFLLEPLTEEQTSAVSAATHFPDAVCGPAIVEAREIMARNAKLPCKFTESLDACRLVEDRLGKYEIIEYSKFFGELCWTGVDLFRAPYSLAMHLVEVLKLKPPE